MRLIDKLLHKEDIVRDDSGKIYLQRWTLLRFKENFWLWKKLGIADIRVYLHKFVDNDMACLHNHPNKFISLMLWHGYREYTYNNKTKVVEAKDYHAPCLRRLPAKHTHRIELIDGRHAWTVVVMFPKEHEWGFVIVENGKRKWVHWQTYVSKLMGKSRCD